MSCKDRSGFLFSHECDRDAVAFCELCGTHVCTEHLRHGSDLPEESRGEMGPEQVLCASCFKKQLATAGRDDEDDDSDSDDDPYCYAYGYHSGYSYYDTRDYRAFDRDTADATDQDALDSGLDAS